MVEILFYRDSRLELGFGLAEFALKIIRPAQSIEPLPPDVRISALDQVVEDRLRLRIFFFREMVFRLGKRRFIGGRIGEYGPYRKDCQYNTGRRERKYRLVFHDRLPAFNATGLPGKTVIPVARTAMAGTVTAVTAVARTAMTTAVRGMIRVVGVVRVARVNAVRRVRRVGRMHPPVGQVLQGAVMRRRGAGMRRLRRSRTFKHGAQHD